MAAKAVLVLCASALLVKTISAVCINTPINTGILNGENFATIGNGVGLATNGLSLAGCGTGLGLTNPGLGLTGLGGLASGLVAAGNGGSFTVASSSPLAPTGLSVISDNAFEGPINLGGQLPVLSAVALEGQVSNSGVSGVSYSCGNGNVGIVSEGLGAGTGLGYGYGAGLGLGNAGLGLGLPNAGLGLANAGLVGAGLGRPGCGLI